MIKLTSNTTRLLLEYMCDNDRFLDTLKEKRLFPYLYPIQILYYLTDEITFYYSLFDFSDFYYINKMEPPKEHPPESLLEYFEGEVENDLYNLADKIVNFTPIAEEYLNRKAMKEDIYNALNDLYFANQDFNIPDLSDDPDFEENLEHSIFYDFARGIYFEIILGLKPGSYGFSGKTLIIRDATGEEEYSAITDLVKDEFIKMVNDYRELKEDKEKRRI